MPEESAITEEMREIARNWRYEPYTSAVERVRIRDYADAIDDPNPLWRDPEYARSIGYDDVPAPPTFLHAFVLHHHGQRSPIPRPFKRGFSASDEIETYRPIQAGDVLTVTGKVADLWERVGSSRTGRMVFVRHEYTYTDQRGAVVGKVNC